jgi:transposase
VDQDQPYYEEKYRERVIKNLTKRAEALGFQLTPTPEMP